MSVPGTEQFTQNEQNVQNKHCSYEHFTYTKLDKGIIQIISKECSSYNYLI